MEAIQIFHSEQFGDIRTAGDSNEPRFCLTDLCSTLELNPSKVAQRLEKDDVLSKYPILDNLGRNQLANFVNEDGLYDVILDSRKPEAKAFRKWITSEVLPAIRKQGGYIASTPQESPEEIMARALLVASATIDRIKEQNRLQSNQLIQAAPKVEYFDTVLQSQSTYVTDQIAKELGTTAITLNKKLAEMSVQFRRGEQWVLTAKYVGRGYTKTRTTSFTGSDGSVRTSILTVWTEAGRKFIHDLFKLS